MKKQRFNVLISALLSVSPQVFAAPSGAEITSGLGSIETVDNITTITQLSDQININFNDFSIAENEVVRFLQPSSSAIAFNQVVGSQSSLILGQLTANGQIVLVNAAGITFGATARVDVAGLIATTLHQVNQSTGKMVLSRGNQADIGRVVNAGEITAEGGLVILAGDYAQNTGIIQARLGQVVLASTQQLSLDFNGDGLISFAIDKTAVSSLAGVHNTGTLSANGGHVLMTASVASDLAATAVRNDGLIEAKSIVEHNGEITLSGFEGDVIHSGTLIASGDESVDGGKISLLGNRVAVIDDAVINASGQNGGEILIGGDFQGKGDVPTAQFTQINQNTNIEANAIGTGNGGKVIVWSDDATRFTGTINAQGGAIAGNGGLVEVSGKQKLQFNGEVSVAAANGEQGTLLLDPETITIVSGADGQNDNDVADAEVLFSDAVGGAFVISEAALEGLTSTVILQADDTIIVNNLGDNQLNLAGLGVGASFILQAGGSIQFADVNDSITTGGGNIHIEGNSPHSVAANADSTVTTGNLDATSQGNVTILGSNIRVEGKVVGATVNIGSGTTAGSNGLGVDGQNVTAGLVELASPNIQLIASGDLTIQANQLRIQQSYTANAQNITFTSLSSPILFDEVFFNSGDVNMTASGDVTFNGGVDSSFTILNVTAGNNIVLNGDTVFQPAIFDFSAGQDIIQNGDLDLERVTDGSAVSFQAERNVVITGAVLGNQTQLEIDLSAGQNLQVSGAIELQPNAVGFGGFGVVGNVLSTGSSDVIFQAGGDINLADITLFNPDPASNAIFNAETGGVTFGTLSSSNASSSFGVEITAQNDVVFAAINNNGGALNISSINGSVNPDADLGDAVVDLPTFEEVITAPTDPNADTAFDSSANAGEVAGNGDIDDLQEAIVSGEDPTDLQETPAAGEEEEKETVIDLTDQPLVVISNEAGETCVP